MHEITTEEVAKLLNLTARRVRQMSNPDPESGQTVLERSDSGDYDIYQVVPAYFAYKEETGLKAEKLAADTEIAKIKAQSDDQKLKQSRGELVLRSGVKKIWRDRLSGIRQQCHEWHQRTMDIGNLKPMQREQQDNEFIEFFNELGSADD